MKKIKKTIYDPESAWHIFAKEENQHILAVYEQGEIGRVACSIFVSKLF